MWTSSSDLSLNSWWPRVGGVGVWCPVSSLLISLNSQLLMAKGRWGGGVVSCSSLLISLNSQLLMTNGGCVGVGCPPPHCSSQLSTPDDQGWVGWGVVCPPHWSSHQPSWLQFSSEMKLTSITVCQHSLSYYQHKYHTLWPWVIQEALNSAVICQ